VQSPEPEPQDTCIEFVHAFVVEQMIVRSVASFALMVKLEQAWFAAHVIEHGSFARQFIVTSEQRDASPHSNAHKAPAPGEGVEGQLQLPSLQCMS
jgi:hypothetical protein